MTLPRVRLVTLLVGVWLLSIVASKSCDREPPGKTSSKSPDNGYKILVSGNPTHYVPGQTYTVILRGHKTFYIEQKFTGFMLVVEPKGHENTVEKRNVGQFHLFGESLTKLSPDCPNAVVQTSVIPKPEIRAKWIAPPAGSGCVLFKATVIEQPEVWYMDDGGLTKQLCETEENVDEQPQIIEECCACDEAKYEVTFEGLWSRHTHPKDFPTNLQLVHFSDIIGASHSADFRMWEYGGKASPGVKDLAQYGATKRLESELKSESNWIRTIIKARGLWYPTTNGKTFAVFRVDRKHHLMSLLSMLGPSPDWVVGVSALELCTQNCSWVGSKTLDLYPWDAGTDSGITYMSDDNATFPQGHIKRITNTYPSNDKSPFYNPKLNMKPLARLTISRKRIYAKACGEGTEPFTWIPEVSGNPDPAVPECAVTNWSPFSSCPVTCGPGIVMRTREYKNKMKASMFDCQAQLTEKKLCEDSPNCNSLQPNRCRTSLWSEWSECGVTCGKGFRMRQRKYLSRKARKFCTEPLSEKEMCLGKEPECPPTDKVMNPECTVTQWSEWSPCTVTCGKGFRVRTRLYLRLQQNDRTCDQEVMQKTPCMADRIDCAISPAEAKEVCVKKKKVGPCRGYFPRWYYDVTKGLCLQFIYGGCRGNQNNFEHYVECKQVCEMIKGTLPSPLNIRSRQPTDMPPKSSVDASIDCMVTEWSPWSACSKTCGKGRRERRRMIKVEAQNGGVACPAKLIQRRKCRDNKPCPVDCMVGQWSSWSQCSQTCGEATRKRTRAELKRSRHGGKQCEPTTQSRYCDFAACPSSNQHSSTEWDRPFYQ